VYESQKKIVKKKKSLGIALLGTLFALIDLNVQVTKKWISLNECYTKA